MEELIEKCAVDGIVARKDLVAAGATRTQLRAAQDGGRLVRLGRCLFATSDADEGVVTAVAAGGTLTCLSALERMGVWTLDVGEHHHIRRPPRRRRDGAVVGAIECRSTLPHRRRPVDSLDAALVAAVLNHSDLDAIVALDHVLNAKLRTRSELEQLFVDAPGYARRLLSRATELVESPLESVVRYRLGQHGIRVRSQVHVPGAGRFDLLVGRRVLIELDGFEHHRTRRQFREDRRRDRRARALGYVVLRFTWDDVMFAWPSVLGEVLAFVGNDFHRLPPRPLAGRRPPAPARPSEADPTRRTESTQGWPVPSPPIPLGGSGRAAAAG